MCIVFDLCQVVRLCSFVLELQVGKGYCLVLDFYLQVLVVFFELMLVLVCLLFLMGCDIFVVVDVGYGGKDFGVVGSKGECEKDVVLVIVCLLVWWIDCEKGFKVCLVCNGDVFVLLCKWLEVVWCYNVDMFVLVYVDVVL